MMARPFRADDRDAWLDLIAQAIRLHNPKVNDLAPLKRKAKTVNKLPLPNTSGNMNVYCRLIRTAEQLQPGQLIERQKCTDQAFEALELLSRQKIGSKARDALRQEALRGFECFRRVIGGLCESNPDAA